MLQLNCENRKLKYLSLSSRPCLDDLLPSISDCIALEADPDADMADKSPDNFMQYQQQVKGSNIYSYRLFDVKTDFTSAEYSSRCLCRQS